MTDEAYKKILERIESMTEEDFDKLVQESEASTKEHVTKLPKEWYDPSEDGLYDEGETSK